MQTMLFRLTEPLPNCPLRPTDFPCPYSREAPPDAIDLTLRSLARSMRRNACQAAGRAMSDKRYLPLWLHRIFNGLFPAVLLAGLGMFWYGEPVGSWRHIVSICLIWSSLPVGIVFAIITRRFSVVEGVAGEVGYEEEEPSDKEPLA